MSTLLQLFCPDSVKRFVKRIRMVGPPQTYAHLGEHSGEEGRYTWPTWTFKQLSDISTEIRGRPGKYYSLYKISIFYYLVRNAQTYCYLSNSNESKIVNSSLMEYGVFRTCRSGASLCTNEGKRVVILGRLRHLDIQHSHDIHCWNLSLYCCQPFSFCNHFESYIYLAPKRNVEMYTFFVL